MVLVCMFFFCFFCATNGQLCRMLLQVLRKTRSLIRLSTWYSPSTRSSRPAATRRTSPCSRRVKDERYAQPLRVLIKAQQPFETQPRISVVPVFGTFFRKIEHKRWLYQTSGRSPSQICFWASGSAYGHSFGTLEKLLTFNTNRI